MQLSTAFAFIPLLLCTFASATPMTLHQRCRQDAEEAIKSRIVQELKANAGERVKIGKFGFVNEKLLTITRSTLEAEFNVRHERIDQQVARRLPAPEFGKNATDHLLLYFGVNATSEQETQNTERFIGYAIMKITPQALAAGVTATSACGIYEIFASRIEKQTSIVLAQTPLVSERIDCLSAGWNRNAVITRNGFPSLLDWTIDRDYKCLNVLQED